MDASTSEGDGKETTSSPDSGGSTSSDTVGSETGVLTGSAMGSESGASESSSGDTGSISEDCSSIDLENETCLAIAIDLGQGSYVVRVGLDSGNACKVATLDWDLRLPDISSLVHQGEWLYTCATTVFRMSLADGSTDDSGIACNAVVGFDGKLLVKRTNVDSDLYAFDSFEALMADSPSTMYPLTYMGSRLVIHEGSLYAAWHSTSTIDVHAFPSGELTRTIMLEGFDDWVDGMARLGSGSLAVLAQRTQERIASFDPETGQSHGDISVQSSLGILYGLACP